MTDAPVEGAKLRRAQPADVADIRALTHAAYAKWVAVIGREPLPMLADYDLAVREHAIDLLYAGGQLAGLIETANNKDHLLIVNVAVAPALQSRGYGRLLLAHAERLATSLSLFELRLYTNEKFAVNVALYRRLGYVIDRVEPLMSGLTVHMSKKLAKP